MNTWLVDNGVSSILLLAGLAAVVYLSRTRIQERLSVAWREVAQANKERIIQLEGVVAEQAKQIGVLTGQVDVLSQRPDLTDALHELAVHEVAAQDRHASLLAEIRELISKMVVK